MQSFRQVKDAWQKDRLLQAVIRRSTYLFSSSTLSVVILSGVGFVTALMLGPADYGALGMIILYASTVNRLLSFRMGELVVKYGGQALAVKNREQAAAVIRLAAAAEAVTSVLAYLVLLLSAPLAAQYILKDPAYLPWITYYGLTILANLMVESSTAVLQVGNHYRTQAALGLVQTGVTALGVLAALGTGGGLVEILTAYLLGKLLSGLGSMGAAAFFLPRLLGSGWWKARLDSIPNRGELLRFALSTNLAGTVNMVVRDSELLWIGFFLTRVEAGYYKFALAVMNVILMPVQPFITTTFPEISKAVAQKTWERLRYLLRRTSILASAWTGACLLGMLLLGRWGLAWVKQGAYLPSYPAVLILLLGYGVSNVFFWNRPLLLAFGQAGYPLRVTLAVGAVKTALVVLLVPALGYLAQAGLLSGYLILTVLLLVRKGLHSVRLEERL